MNINQVREALTRRPFRAFRLRTADDYEYEVRHPEFMALAQDGRSVFVSKENGAFEILDLLLVSSLIFHAPNGDSHPPPPGGRNGKRKKK
ncbi:MAG TPA: hypothetical protein DEB06_03495 [Phycisphaerales bacterium]|nr:hypothetical protein [Phycisphaerales bacterium]